MKLSDGFNGADLRNVCTEAGIFFTPFLANAKTASRSFLFLAQHPSCCPTSLFLLPLTGMFAIRADHDFVVQEDFMKAVRKVADSKKLESKLDYKPV